MGNSNFNTNNLKAHNIMSDKKNVTPYEFVSPARYLTLEEVAPERSEYYAGRMIKMAGASLNHARISRNIVGELLPQLKDTACELLMSDVKLSIREGEKFYYPDLMLVCGAVDLAGNRNDTITNPVLICEVLSTSTAGRDRGEKFHDYQAISSVQYYMMVDQYQKQIEVFFRQPEDIWLYKLYKQNSDVIVLKGVGVKMKLESIYHKVEIPVKDIAYNP